MIRLGVEEDPIPEAKEFLDMLRDAEKPLYDGCELSFMSMAARIMDFRSKYNVPLKGIDGLTSLVKDLCPDSSKDRLTVTLDGTRKLIAGLELPCQKIDICLNGCMLFWKGDACLEICSSCNASRYRMNSKGKLIPQKVLLYFPITPRLQRLYATKGIAEQMRWHSENCRANGLMAHPCDGEAWKKFDAIYPEFANEVRNVRLGFYIDLFSQFEKYGKPYLWTPVILTPYNLPPWLCMKRPFMFLSLMIPGFTSPTECLDVYLQPLVEELKQLWSVGAMTYDISKKQNFNMRAAIMWTICNFPTYTLLSGHTATEMFGCPYPYCMEYTKPLTPNRGYKQTAECQLLSSLSNLSKTPDLENTSGRHEMHIWREQSIFWELPYWSKLLIRHSVDLKYIEKIVVELLFHNMMVIKEHTKDKFSLKRDLVSFRKLQKQHLQAIVDGDENRDLMYNAPYVLNKEQRKALCEWIEELKFPGGYASNLSQCVDLNEYKLFGMNNHDCHVLIERLLPVALKDFLTVDRWTVIAMISKLFRDLSSPLLQTKDMVHLETAIPEILCKLEEIFPRTFIKQLEHQLIHLPYEAKVGGPICYRWIYPFERCLHHLKTKVSSKGRLEDSICCTYLTEEVSNFLEIYFERLPDKKTKDKGCIVGRGVQELVDGNLLEPFAFTIEHANANGETRLLDGQDYRAAHKCVLANCELLREYEKLFEQEIRRRHPSIRSNDIWSMFEHQFSDWFKHFVLNSNIISDDIIRTLAMGPSRVVQKMDHCNINGYNFHTYAYGKSRSTMNYGACVKGVEDVEYYGIIQEIIELLYAGATTCYRTILFKCDWMDSGMGLNVHEDYKLVEVNNTRENKRFEPFVLANRVRQVYFAPYPSTRNDRNQWLAIFKIKGSSISHVLGDDIIFQEEVNENPLSLSEGEQDEDRDDQAEEDGDDEDEEDENDHDEPEQEDEAQVRELEAENQRLMRYSMRKRSRK